MQAFPQDFWLINFSSLKCAHCFPGALESPPGCKHNKRMAAPLFLPVDLPFHFQVKQIKTCIFSAVPASSGDPTSMALRIRGIQLGTTGGELFAAVPAVPQGQCRPSNLVYNFSGPRELLCVSSGGRCTARPRRGGNCRCS